MPPTAEAGAPAPAEKELEAAPAPVETEAAPAAKPAPAAADDDDDDDTGVRHYTSAKARHTLEGIFQHKPYPSPEMCKNLAKQFGCMTPKQVQNWFQNRRQREKKMASLNPAIATPSTFVPQMRVQYAIPGAGFAPFGWLPHGAPPMAQPVHILQSGLPGGLSYIAPGGPAVIDATTGQIVHFQPQPMPIAGAAVQPQLHLVPSTMIPQFAAYSALPAGGAIRHGHSLFGAGMPWPPRQQFERSSESPAERLAEHSTVLSGEHSAERSAD